MERRQLALIKGEQKFVFRYSDGAEEAVLDSFIHMASDRESEFDWFDAAVLSFQLSKRLVDQTDELLCDGSGMSDN